MKKIAFITDIHLDDQFPKDVGVNSEKNWNWIVNDIRSKIYRKSSMVAILDKQVHIPIFSDR